MCVFGGCTGLTEFGLNSTVVWSQTESLIKLTFICFLCGSAAVHMLDARPMLKDSRQVVEANHTVGFIAGTHHSALFTSYFHLHSVWPQSFVRQQPLLWTITLKACFQSHIQQRRLTNGQMLHNILFTSGELLPPSATLKWAQSVCYGSDSHCTWKTF